MVLSLSLLLPFGAVRAEVLDRSLNEPTTRRRSVVDNINLWTYIGVETFGKSRTLLSPISDIT